MGLALRAASQAAVLNRGHIVLRDPAAELVAHPEQLEDAYLGT